MSRFSGRRRDSGRNSSSGLWLKSRIAELDFSSFQRCVWLWLGASGYRHMLFCGRRAQRGRSAAGPDFLVRIGDEGMNVAVQIRHWKSPVSKRAVDELRGVLLRDNIPAGMIVASSTCSPAARFAAEEYGGRPIRIIGIDRFCESLDALGIRLDDKFFALVGQFTLGTAAASTMAHRMKANADMQYEADFGSWEPINWPLLIVLTLILGLVAVWRIWR